MRQVTSPAARTRGVPRTLLTLRLPMGLQAPAALQGPVAAAEVVVAVAPRAMVLAARLPAGAAAAVVVTVTRRLLRQTHTQGQFLL